MLEGRRRKETLFQGVPSDLVHVTLVASAVKNKPKPEKSPGMGRGTETSLAEEGFLAPGPTACTRRRGHLSRCRGAGCSRGEAASTGRGA